MLFALLTISTLSFAKKSFVESDFTTLEKQVIQRHSLETVSKKLAQIKSYQNWNLQIESDLLLYVGIKWIQKTYEQQGFDILKNLKVADEFVNLHHYYMARLFIKMSQLKMAETHMTALEKVEAKNPDYLLLKSQFFAQQGIVEKSIEPLNVALKIDKTHGTAYFNRALLHLLLADYNKAYKDFVKAIQYLDKKNIKERQQAYLQAGLILKNLKKNDKKAESFFAKGTALDPNSDLVKELERVLKKMSFK